MGVRRGGAPAKGGDSIHLDAIADRVAIIGLDGKFQAVNQAMLDFHHLRRQDFVGHDFLERIAPEDRDRIWKRFSEIIEKGGGSGNFEYKSLSPSGEVFYSELNAMLVYDAAGLPMEVIAVIRDISQRKEVERKLAESEEMYRNLLDNICEAVYEIDENAIIRFVSAGIESIIGCKPNELCGRNVFEIIYPEDVEFIKEQFQLVARGILHSSEYRIVGKNGEGRWISSSSRPIFRDGKFCGLNGVLIDIHERKVAQETLRHQQELLQQAQKMEAIGTLAGGIAHDFNNLLMGIEGRVSLMLLDCDADQPAYGHLKGIEEHVRSAAELTRQLLGLARGGKYELRSSDLNELIRRSIDLFGRTRKEITIASRLDPGLWAVEIDRAQIEQVLLNLLVNAGQAMPNGGPVTIESLNLELREGDPCASQVRPGRFVRVGIRDAGIGMDEETKNRIFNPFFTTKEMGRGTGLGLASAYGIVKNHGGVITVYSEKGSGSTFHVYLPASTKPVETEAAAVEEIVGGGETILLIDDEAMILDVARQMLENLGYRVLAAGDGTQALDIFRRNRGAVDLVILDMIMPRMGGGKVFDALKELDPDVRILLSSGYSIDGQAMEIMRRGCRGFIQKPFGIKELAAKLRSILDQ